MFCFILFCFCGGAAARPRPPCPPARSQISRPPPGWHSCNSSFKLQGEKWSRLRNRNSSNRNNQKKISLSGFFVVVAFGALLYPALRHSLSLTLPFFLNDCDGLSLATKLGCPPCPVLVCASQHPCPTHSSYWLESCPGLCQ